MVIEASICNGRVVLKKILSLEIAIHNDRGYFGHNNRLRTYYLQVQPVTCRHPPVFLHFIGVHL